MCLLHVCEARFPDAPSCLRLGRAPTEAPNFVWVMHPWKPQISFEQVRMCRVWVPMQTRSSRSGWVRSCHVRAPRAHVPIPKMLSCDWGWDLCTFMQPVFMTLPHAFISVVSWNPCKLVRVGHLPCKIVRRVVYLCKIIQVGHLPM